ncbi:MAG: DNA repair protein RecN [Thermoflexales bacterium]
MLCELRVRDFAIIDALDLEFASGLNVLTGETGAGKSIIVDCIALLLGDRAEPSVVRSGAQAALIEGIFRAEGALCHAIAQRLETYGIALEDTLTLGREVRINGRSVARINGRAVNQAALREVGELLVDIHGQSEHLSLLRSREHVNLLDRFANTWELREQVAALYGELRSIQRRIEEIRQQSRERARRVDMLRFQAEEIRAARLKPDEETALLEEHVRLANAEALAALTDEAYRALYESAYGAPAALDQLAAARRALAQLERFDRQFADLHHMLDEANTILEEVARALRDYRDSIAFNPRRLQQVEERLELIKRLKRKYGETVEAVIAFGEQVARELEQIESADEQLEGLAHRERQLSQHAQELASQLSAQRAQAAEAMRRGVERELADLRMAGARFDVHITTQPLDSTGCDAVEFLIAPNIGEGFKPLAKIASGGETARLMLALKATLALADNTPTLIFDEIDQGIGGRVGTTVGQKLWQLARHHQVLCITHLPQLAAFADAHFKVSKHTEGDRTVTRVQRLDQRARADELAQMLGTGGAVGLTSAEQLLAEAEQFKRR